MPPELQRVASLIKLGQKKHVLARIEDAALSQAQWAQPHKVPSRANGRLPTMRSLHSASASTHWSRSVAEPNPTHRRPQRKGRSGPAHAALRGLSSSVAGTKTRASRQLSRKAAQSSNISSWSLKPARSSYRDGGQRSRASSALPRRRQHEQHSVAVSLTGKSMVVVDWRRLLLFVNDARVGGTAASRPQITNQNPRTRCEGRAYAGTTNLCALPSSLDARCHRQHP